jgi:predicted dehydrogenase
VHEGKIRVGIIGASQHRGWAASAHIPALRALPDFEITAVCTTRQESADAVARQFGIPLAFADARALAQHPDVDVVAVTVKVPEHKGPVLEALEAGKHVFCEWPLGRNTAEAETMHDLAERRGNRHVVGLQGGASPTIRYVSDLIAEGAIGRVLSATSIASAPNWGSTLDRPFQADRTNGANLLTIAGGHALNVLRTCVGEFAELSAFVVSQRDRIPIEGSNDIVAKTSPDQLVVSGVTELGAVVAFQVRGGMNRGIGSLLEIHGDAGDIVLSSPSSLHHDDVDMVLRGAREPGAPLADLPVPDHYRRVPDGVPRGAPFNVAHLYVKLAEALRDGSRVEPGFDAAVIAHRLLDTIQRASDTGQRQRVEFE